MAFIFGLLGRGFGGLASARGHTGNAVPPPSGDGTMDFSDEDNSGLLVLLEDI